MSKMREVLLSDAPSTFVFVFSCCWACFSGGRFYSELIKISSSAVRPVRTRRTIPRATRSFSISYSINYQPFDILLTSSDATDPRDQAIRKCDPIPSPLRFAHDPQHAFYPRRRFSSFVTSLSPSPSPFRDRFTPHSTHRHSCTSSCSQR